MTIPKVSTTQDILFNIEIPDKKFIAALKDCKEMLSVLDIQLAEAFSG
jgi:hypothetical protein